MCAGREFQVEGADTEKAREEMLLVIPAGLVRRFFMYMIADRQTNIHTETDRHAHHNTPPPLSGGVTIEQDIAAGK